MTSGPALTPGWHHDTGLTLHWLGQGTQLLAKTVADLADPELDAPSALPGWTRRHVIAHLARNAEALERLLVWAETGIERPMYASPTQRAEEIEQSSQFRSARLRRELSESASSLERHCRRLTEGQWQVQVRSATGRTLPAAEVPWLRNREVWLHTIDLDAGVTAEAIPQGVADILIADVVGGLADEAVPPLRLASESSGLEWLTGANPRQLVTGRSSALAAWLTGRTDGSELHSRDPLPRLPAWL